MDHNRDNGEKPYRTVDLEDAINVRELTLQVHQSSAMKDFRSTADTLSTIYDYLIYEKVKIFTRGLIRVRDFPFDLLSARLNDERNIDRKCINPLCVQANIHYWFQVVLQTEKKIALFKNMGPKKTGTLIVEMRKRGLELLGPEVGRAFLNRDFRMIDFYNNSGVYIPPVA